MCGRYTLEYHSSFNQRFSLPGTVNFESHYNISPSQLLPIILVANGENTLQSMRWGFIPAWAKDKSLSRQIINARVESVAHKPSFASAFRHRRCLVPASGFYEWQNSSNGKIPFYFYSRESKYFSFAGIYENDSYTIITAAANSTVKSIHNRMPLILAPSQETLWLRAPDDDPVLNSILTDAPKYPLDFHPVSAAVNSPDNDNPALIKPL
ncbi:MAG: SOS response-associated peptidase [Patescibacteria group bacterium]|jgi:putative SOS response-associated peptidase YedK